MSDTSSSTFFAVSNRKALESRIAVTCLGGLKLPVKNLNYANEVSSMNAVQKESIQVVQQERLAKKYYDWNEQYMHSSALMKSKYYEKHENMTRLGDKEDEDAFWNQWKTLKSTCEDQLANVEKQHNRYEERVCSILNQKYKHAFKNLPACARQQYKLKPAVNNSPPTSTRLLPRIKTPSRVLAAADFVESSSTYKRKL